MKFNICILIHVLIISKNIWAYNIEGRYQQKFLKASKVLERAPEGVDQSLEQFEDSIYFGNSFKMTTFKNAIM